MEVLNISPVAGIVADTCPLLIAVWLTIATHRSCPNTLLPQSTRRQGKLVISACIVLSVYSSQSGAEASQTYISLGGGGHLLEEEHVRCM